MNIRPNPALYEESINQPMKTVPLALRETLFSWLERTGRFQSSDVDESQEHKIPEDLDEGLEPEIYLLDDEDEQLD